MKNGESSVKMSLAASKYGKERDYWLNKFSGELVKVKFPYDRSETGSEGKYAVRSIVFNDKLFERLMQVSKKSDYTLHMILTAVVVAMLARYTARKDIIVGMPIYTQDREGEFLNTALALRNQAEDHMSFKDLLLQVRQTIIEANQHQNYPLETLLYHLNMTFSRDEFPLFDVVILLENIHQQRYIEYTHPNVIFSFFRTDDSIIGKVRYNTLLYNQETLERIVHHLKRLLEEAVFNVEMPLLAIEFLSGEEKRQLLWDFNGGHEETGFPEDKTLHRLFQEQVERTPDDIALVGQSAERKAQSIERDKERHAPHAMRYSLTYRELNKRAHGLAHLLRQKRVEPDTIVALMMEVSVEMIVGIFGILKAGGTYLPIDPDYPEERINYILEDSSVEVLVTTPKLQVKAEVEERFIEIIDISNLSSFSTLTSTSTCQVSPANLAYIIYTSGTTGKPKGTLIQHRNVVSLMFHDNYLFNFDRNDVWTMFHSYCFDFSVWEMYGALLYGGKLVLIPRTTARDPEQYLGILKKEKVTILNQTPAAFYNLILRELESPGKKLHLKYIIFGGEALSPGKLEKWQEKYPETMLINMFGITETTVHVTYKKLETRDIDLNISSIGGPIPTLSTYVMDKNLKLVPIGAPGEICVGGKGVCRGYLNRPELTAEKFVENPYIPGERIYRSGDLVKLAANGQLEYLGRIDHQVKIRGYRVELGEIENLLMGYLAVKEAVVIAGEQDDKNRELAAYVVPHPGYAREVSQLVALERSGRLRNHTRHEYPNGMTIFCINRNETDFMYQEIFENKSYIKHGITLGDAPCVFDVGANIGMFSLYVSHVCKDAKIFAFEPIPPVFELLFLNTSIYCRDIEVFPLGLSEKENEAIFTYYPHATVLSGRFADRSQETETVKAFIKNEPKENPEEERLSEGQINELLEDRLKSTSFTCKMKSLSQIIREKGIEKIDLLKIDVEKAEIDVLKGIDETDWPRIRQLVIEVHDVDEGLEKITQQLRQRGYRVVVQQDSELKNTNLYNVYAVSEAKSTPGSQRPVLVKNNAADGDDYYLSPGRFIDDLRTFLKEKVPEYMVPSYFVLVDHIPLNPNGKVDRKALPSPEIKSGSGYIAPRNQVEIKLAEIWAEVLRIEKDAIGIDSDFFQLGGHSLKATIFISKLHKVLDVKVPLAVLFKTPTIRELAGYISGLKTNRFVSLETVEKKEYYLLSSAQKRLYVLQQMELESIAYNVPQAYELEGELNRKALENTFRQLLKRHESLRTSFDMVSAEPVQRIHKGSNFKIEYFDFKVDQAKVEKKEGTGGLVPLPIEGAAALISYFIRPFDLSQAPLLRVGLIKVEDRKHILMVDMHHIITDGTSMDLFVKESMALYVGEELPPLKFQYKDYSQWQNSPQQKKALREQEEYWLRQFPGEVAFLNLPLDYSRPEVQSFEGDILLSELSIESTGALKQLALDTGTTLYMVLLAIYNVLLSKLSGQEDIVVGTPTAARRHANLERIIGMFVNTLAMRNYPRGNKKFIDFLKELKKRTLEAFENQEYQFEDLVEKVSVHRDPSRNPIFDALFGLQNMEGQASEIPIVDITQLKIRPYESEHRTAKFDLNLTCFENEEKLFCFFEYCTKLFKKETIQRFINYFRKLVSIVSEDLEIKISDMEVMSEEEKRQLLSDFNNTGVKYPKDKSIHQLFEEQVERTPDRTALYGCMDAWMHVGAHITYRDLNERSSQFAVFLKKKGIKPETIVVIMMERSLEMIIGIIAILKAGGAYLPIDPGYPEERISYMLADSEARVLVRTAPLAKEVNNLRSLEDKRDEIIFIDSLDFSSLSSSHFLNFTTFSSSLAYVIYTSGTTGKPKGILVEHYSVVNLVCSQEKLFGIHESERILQFSSICFDASVEQIFIALTSGAALVLIDKDIILDQEGFETFISTQLVTHIHAVPSFLKHMRLKPDNHLKRIISGGDICPVGLAKKWSQSCDFYNEYGPTETTVTSIVMLVNQVTGTSAVLPIGKPIGNTRVYLLDKWMMLVPIGVIGELYIGGDGVARGYLNNPELTCEKFDHDLWDLQDYHDERAKNFYNKKFLRGGSGGAVFSKSAPPGRRRQKIYKTGDLACWLGDGNIEFLGRMDHQVKVRGFRVEPGEIENQLLKHGKVKEAVVVVREDKVRDKYLAAYIVPGRDGEALEYELREYLLKVLPDYMVPSYFMQVDQIPLTPSGKVHRAALPTLEISAGEGERYVAPRDEIERKLQEIWSDILGRDALHASQLRSSLGIDDNFFQLGGHSLKATAVISAIYDNLDIRVPLIEIFRTPTIRQLARYIKDTDKDIVLITDEHLVLLKKSPDSAGHLFFIHDISGEVDSYLELCEHLDSPLSYWGLRADRLTSLGPRNCTVEELASKYVEKIKKVQPRGPYYIAGWSLGGTIAFEMVSQLEQMNEEIGFFAMIDTPPPPKGWRRQAIGFNLESELDFVKNYSACANDSEMKKKLKNVKELSQLWPLVVNYLEKNNHDAEVIKEAVIEYGMPALPNFHQLNIRDSIYYLNVGRTFHHAWENYRPGGKIQTPIDYFAAVKSKVIKKEHWNAYCSRRVKFYEVPGDHFSIFKKPGVETFAQLFHHRLHSGE